LCWLWPTEIIAEVQHFAEYREVPNIEYDNFNVRRYSKNWFKLNAWNFTEFTSIVLLDADTVIVKSLGHVFELPTDFAWSFQNAPEYNWNKGGFIMLRPCQPVLEHMLSILEHDDTKHFPITPTGPPSLWFKRLPLKQSVGSSIPGFS